MKNLFQISLSGITFFGFLILFYSCHHDPACDCQVTDQDKAFLSEYNQGDIVVFKNDTTLAFDTLKITYKGTEVAGSSLCGQADACRLAPGHVVVYGIFLKNSCGISVDHGGTPVFYLRGGYSFGYSGSAQIMTINSTVYNDVHICSNDSTKILNSDRTRVPWKINYSTSKGLIRCYMVSGQTWSKL